MSKLSDLIERDAALAVLIAKYDRCDENGYCPANWCEVGVADLIRALPTVQPQVAVKPLEWREDKTYGLHSTLFVADTIFGRVSIEYGGWANEKLCLSVPWQARSIWLENDPPAAIAAVQADYDARIRAALVADTNPLGAVAMRESLLRVVAESLSPVTSLYLLIAGKAATLPLPDHAALLRAARELPEIKAVVASLNTATDYVSDAATGALQYRGKGSITDMANDDLMIMVAALAALEAGI